MKYRDLGYKTRILKRKRHQQCVQHGLRLKNEIDGLKLPVIGSIVSDHGCCDMFEGVEFIDDNNAKAQA